MHDTWTIIEIEFSSIRNRNRISPLKEEKQLNLKLEETHKETGYNRKAHNPIQW